MAETEQRHLVWQIAISVSGRWKIEGGETVKWIMIDVWVLSMFGISLICASSSVGRLELTFIWRCLEGLV